MDLRKELFIMCKYMLPEDCDDETVNSYVDTMEAIFNDHSKDINLEIKSELDNKAAKDWRERKKAVKQM